MGEANGAMIATEQLLFDPGPEVAGAGRVDTTAADRVARMVARRADIGELPPVVDPERREICRNDLVKFGMTYCGSLLRHDPSPALRDYAAVIQGSILNGGLVHVRLPRGCGKSTWCKVAIVWAVAYGHLRYPVIFQASAMLANSLLEDVWALIETSDAFLDDFPEIAWPIRCLEGVVQRCAIQRYHGARTMIRRNADRIVLPTIEGSPSSGAIIVAKGAGAACRGMVHGSDRPDFVLLDDVQTRDDAPSEARCAKLSAWVMQDVLGLSGEQQLAGIMASTPIRPGDLSDQFADPAQHPEWRLVEHRLVSSWAEREDLWGHYDVLWAEDAARGDSTASSATRYYAEHRDQMDVGAATIDSDLFDRRMELSSIQHARNLLLRVGQAAFSAEYQLQPRRDSAAVEIAVQHVTTALNGCPRRTLPPGTSQVLSFIDVMQDRLRFATMAFGPHQMAAVIDYGVYPEQGRVAPVNAPDRVVEASLARALMALARELLSWRYRRADGREVTAHALWMDAGWRTRVVNTTAAFFRRMGHANVLGARGVTSAAFDADSRSVVARGPNVQIRERDGVRWAAHNADALREAVQCAFLGAPMAPGSISLWGSDGSVHYDYATQITAERLAAKAVTGRGVSVYKWTMRPGGANHFLDATSGCLAMASWYRFWSSDDVVAGAAREVRESAGVSPLVRSSRAAKARAAKAGPAKRPVFWSATSGRRRPAAVAR